MILKRVRLKNFLAHDDTEIEFSPSGITVFIGENGAGKSSIIEGIVYGIFGKTDRGKLEDLVKWGKREATVEVEFQKGNSEYKVERTITIRGNKGSSTGIIYKKEKGKYRPYYQKHISREIPKITGISYKTFLSSVLVKQGDIEGLIELSPKDRAKIFEDLLDMSLYQLIAENIATKRRVLQEQVKWLEKETEQLKELETQTEKLQEQLESLKTQQEEKQKELQQLNEEQTKLQKQIDLLQSEKEKLIKTKAHIEKLQEVINISHKNLKSLEEKIQHINREKEKLPQLKKQVEKLKQLEEELSKLQELKLLQEKEKNIQEKIEEYNQKSQKLSQIKEIGERYEQTEKKLKQLQEEFTKLQKIQAEKQTLEKQLTNIEKKQQQTLDKLSEILQSLLKLKKSYLILKDNPLTIEQFQKNNQEKLEELSKIKEELTEKKAKIQATGEELKKKLKNISSIEGKCPTCDRPLEEHTQQELIQELEEQLKKLRTEYKELNKKDKEISQQLKIEKEVEPFLQKFKELFDKYSELEKEKTDLKARISVLNSQIKAVADIEKEKQELEKFLTENKNTYHTFVELSRYLKNTDMDSLKKQLETIKNEIQKLTQKTKITDQNQIKQEIEKLKKAEKEYIQILSLIEEKEKISQEIENLQRTIKENTQKIEELKPMLVDEEKIDQQLKELKEKNNQIQQQLKEKNEQLSQIQQELGKTTGQYETLQKEITKTKEAIETAQKIEEKIKKYKKVEEALGPKGIQKIIRDNALYELPRITNIIFSAFDFPFQQVKFSENFDISLLAPTVEKTDRYVSASAISGGQRVALGLALRLAIGKFLSNKAEFLILDEPTVHLDQQRRNELINILINLKERKFVRQLIIVTHDTEVEDAADSIYYVERGVVKPVG